MRYFFLGLTQMALPRGPIRLQVTAAGAQAPRAGHASVLPRSVRHNGVIDYLFTGTTRPLLT